MFFGGLQAAENETPLSMILKTTIKKNKKSNFRPYGQMKQQRWEEPEKKSEKNRRKKMRAKNTFFQCFVAPGGRKVGLLKRRARGTEPYGRMRDQKFHALVARSRFGRKHGQNTSGSQHFWKLRCGKTACRCGTKDI